MSCALDAVCFDANDALPVARFWAELLDWGMADDPRGGLVLVPHDDTGFRLRFVPTEATKLGLNQLHLHLTSSSAEEQERTVEKALRLGARHMDVGQTAEEGHVVLADCDGNEFCVIEPNNRFLADCGFLGELTCDGTQAVGYFWSAALGWPLVWDQDEETSIRSPLGGPKISWGGPPLAPKAGKCRIHFDVCPTGGGDQQAEVERLESLGATRVDIGQRDVDWVVMVDPDGHEFCVLPAR